VDIVEQLAIAVFAIGVGAFIGKIWERARLLRKWGYIRALLGQHRKVQIIVSSVGISAFKFAGGGPENSATRVQVPPNILYMPMPEGRAIATLVNTLKRISPKLKIQLITANNHDPETLTFSIGGPSVNSFSYQTLGADFPDFSIDYPATRRARFEGHSFETTRNPDNALTGDYGFIFVTRTSQDAPCVLFCGIRAFGSAMAVDMFRSMPRKSEAAQAIRNCPKAFIVVEGKVNGLEWSAVRLEFCRAIHPSKTRKKIRTVD
jgi:hypothetical protein